MGRQYCQPANQQAPVRNVGYIIALNSYNEHNERTNERFVCKFTQPYNLIVRTNEQTIETKHIETKKK